MKALYWFVRRWWFLLWRLAVGDSLVEARYRWTLLVMEYVTVRTLKRGMGRFRVITRAAKQELNRIYGKFK